MPGQDKITSTARKKIKVAKVNEKIEEFGRSGKKLKFVGIDKANYECIKQGLFELIKVDAELDADIEIHEVTLQSGDSFIKSLVVELYDKDGKPISPTKASQWRGGSKSSDASIESQVAFKGVIELIVHGVILDTDPLWTKAREWAMSKLSAQPAQPAPAAKTPPPAPPAPAATQAKPTKPALPASAETPTPPPEPSDKPTRDSVLAYVAMKKGWKTAAPALSFIVNKCKISEEMLDTNPEEALKEIRQLEGWE